MEVRWVNAPWWTWWIFYALMSALFFGGMRLILEDGAAAPILSTASAIGVGSGLVAVAIGSNRRERLRAAVGRATPEQRRRAQRAAFSGQPPADPQSRQVTIDLLRFYIAENRRQNLFLAGISLALSTGLWIVLAVMDDPLWFILAILGAAATAWIILRPRLMQERLNRMSSLS